MAEFAIETIALKKKFGSFTAVNALNLKIRKGELFGFLGPNGAGKTTTMRMLTTLTPPTEGKASVAGFDIEGESEHVRSRKASSFALDVVVKPKAEFAAIEPQDALRIGETNYIPITLKNTGSQEARKLKISVIPVYPFSTDGTVRYVETLSPGASATLYYRIPVDKEASEGNEIVTVSVNFEDPNGKKFSDTADLSLSVKPQTISETLAGYWWAGAIALTAAFLIARRKMAGRK
ncbi:ATP-binding cassette domain-containing protein [Candidatus Micrarchaeota archaeon]|nr:ATP-binding cassette domain-containing protein [Candidatus Micrarchaeota archaeon]